MKIIIIICGLFLSQSESKLKDLNFLLGTWQINGKATFETWIFEDNRYSGMGYKLIGDEKKISEYLTIELKNQDIVYSAKVPNQNDGKAIPFVLNQSEKKRFSFENKKHDFPNKIQYEVISEKTIKAHVLNNENKGFSLEMKKVD